ncbi:MAG: hypothetical protein ACUVTX_09935 [Bacteroidales bacterium]
MKILLHLLSGLKRSVKCWKWIIAIWFSTLMLISLFTFPFKSGIYASLGSSMIREKIDAGYFMEVFANDSFNIKTILSYFFPGLFIVLFTGMILNIFFAGGLFNVLKENGIRRRSNDFFGAAAANFWSFLSISVILYLSLLFISGIILGIPALIVSGMNSDSLLSKTFLISSAVLLLLLPLIILVADYSRAWQVSSEVKNAFKSIGQGFRLLFRNFFKSYFLVLLILIVQVIFMLVVVKLILYMRPHSSGGIFLFYLTGQMLAIIKIFLRSWRYGTITDIYESDR